jgi:hypothetical protein
VVTPGAPVSSTNKTDQHDIAEIMLKMALNAITITLRPNTYLRAVVRLVNIFKHLAYDWTVKDE